LQSTHGAVNTRCNQHTLQSIHMLQSTHVAVSTHFIQHTLQSTHVAVNTAFSRDSTHTENKYLWIYLF
jgi:hypothetical protein